MSAKSHTPISDVSSISTNSEIDAVGSIEEELESLFSWTPHCLVDGRKDSESSGNNIILSPLSFYDKHICRNRSLKRVVSNSTIQNTLCSIVNDALTFFEEKNIPFPPINGQDSLFISAADRKTMELYSESSAVRAEDVQELYRTTVGASCVPLASGLLLESTFPYWFCLLSLNKTGERLPNHTPSSSIEDLRVGLFLDFLKDDMDSGTPSRDTKAKLRAQLAGTAIEKALLRVERRFQHLLTFKVLPPFSEADTILRSMSDLCGEESFPWEICHISGASGPPALELPYSVDFPANPFITSTPSPTPVPGERKRKRNEAAESGSQASSNSKTSIIPSLPKHQKTRVVQPVQVQVLHLVQRAWAESVDKDTTIIVFRSGSLERIGIRERKTQTLHLSDLYDIRANEKLPYAKVHVGLFMAIIRDAIGRAEILDSEDKHSKKTRDHERIPSKSILKSWTKVGGVPAAATRSQQKELSTFRDIGKRNLLLIAVRYGNFNSPAPISLFRTGKALGEYDGPAPAPLPSRARKYSELEYIDVTAQTRIGKGATGMAHSGVLSTKLSDGSESKHQVVVKLAFGDTQRSRLENEYKIYERLTEARVDHVLRIWGLFENNVESVSVLVMENGGVSLRYMKNQGRMLDPEDSAPFYDILAKINAAGVIHNDLRPENLLVNKYGRRSIIDFDLGVMTENNTPARSEAGQLKTMLEVFHREKNG